MAELKGSKTEENLQAAFAGESQARNKYTYFAKVARKEGFQYIGDIFEETAMNEMQHAKDEFKKLGGIGDTATNLQEAVDGEDYETNTMYPDFAKVAEEEGFSEIAILFKQIARVEADHRDRYKQLRELITSGDFFKRETAIKWKCGKCGYIAESKEAPKVCPCCKHPQAYFGPVTL